MSEPEIKRGKELLRGFFKSYAKNIKRLQHTWRTGAIADVLDRMDRDPKFYTQVLCATAETVLRGTTQEVQGIAPVTFDRLCTAMQRALFPYTLICKRSELCELIKLVAAEMYKQSKIEGEGEKVD